MFSSSIRASLVALVASAVAVSATPGLSLKISTPSVDVDGLENLKVTTTITNTGDETLKLLNDPRGVLDSFPENSFTITDASGSRPLFTGAKVNPPFTYLTNPRTYALCFHFQVKYSPTYAIGLDDPSVFTVLDPGASKDVSHDRKSDHIDAPRLGHDLTE